MNNQLAPTYQYPFGDYFLLWYAVSNSYSVVDLNFKNILERYLECNTLDTFFEGINLEEVNTTKKALTQTLTTYLKGCNIPNIRTEDTPENLNYAKRVSTKYYTYNGKTFQIYFNATAVQNIIHPALAYLETQSKEAIAIIFDIYTAGDRIYLFKDEKIVVSYPKQEYHKLQGKFITHLLGYIHDAEETDWIGTFHGSTITDGNASILFIGQSGKGKSTLCAILAANGYQLVADDVSPLSSKTANIHNNPSAISIKHGAFNVLEPMIKGFNSLPTTQLHKSKGLIKYVAPAPLKKTHYPCRQIILVNYQKDADTILKKITITKVLETLIPESWLSPNPKHAKQFLDWLQTLAFYEITYSDTESVLKEIKTIFLKNNEAKT